MDMTKPIKTFGLVDLQTRQEYGVMVVPLRRGMGGKWVRVFQDRGKELLVAAKGLHGQSYRILLYLTMEADWTNGVPSSGVLANKLGMTQSAVSRAYKELVQATFLVKKEGRYYLSPFFCWKGSPAQYQERIREMQYPRLLEVSHT
jgi:hypothetical protein